MFDNSTQTDLFLILPRIFEIVFFFHSPPSNWVLRDFIRRAPSPVAKRQNLRHLIHKMHAFYCSNILYTYKPSPGLRRRRQKNQSNRLCARVQSPHPRFRAQREIPEHILKTCCYTYYLYSIILKDH